MSNKPQAGECAPYYLRYTSLVEGDDIVAILEQCRRDMLLLLCSRSDEEGDFRYAPDKWTVKEVLGHICDAERVFAYRALRIARGDQTPLASFEQNSYVLNGPFARTPMSDLIEEYIAVRRATVTLLRNLDSEAWLRRGTASDNEVTVRALAWIIAGHDLHHRNILEEKYFPSSAIVAAER
jgi:uncharacterized damage-inducible protein DinB